MFKFLMNNYKSKQSRPESEEQLKQLVDSEDLETITVEPSLSSKNVSPSDEDIQVTLYASHSYFYQYSLLFLSSL